MNWFSRYAFGSHVGEELASALVILLTFALCGALLRLVFRLLKRERDTDESASDYWRVHGGEDTTLTYPFNADNFASLVERNGLKKANGANRWRKRKKSAASAGTSIKRNELKTTPKEKS